jgi:hypothetical protein
MGVQEVTKRKTCIWIIVVRRRGWTRCHGRRGHTNERYVADAAVALDVLDVVSCHSAIRLCSTIRRRASWPWRRHASLRSNTSSWRLQQHRVIGLLFIQSSAYVFDFSGIRFDRIVNRDSTKRWYQLQFFTPSIDSKQRIERQMPSTLTDIGFVVCCGRHLEIRALQFLSLYYSYAGYHSINLGLALI